MPCLESSNHVGGVVLGLVENNYFGRRGDECENVANRVNQNLVTPIRRNRYRYGDRRRRHLIARASGAFGKDTISDTVPVIWSSTGLVAPSLPPQLGEQPMHRGQSSVESVVSAKAKARLPPVSTSSSALDHPT